VLDLGLTCLPHRGATCHQEYPVRHSFVIALITCVCLGCGTDGSGPDGLPVSDWTGSYTGTASIDANTTLCFIGCSLEALTRDTCHASLQLTRTGDSSVTAMLGLSDCREELQLAGWTLPRVPLVQVGSLPPMPGRILGAGPTWTAAFPIGDGDPAVLGGAFGCAPVGDWAAWRVQLSPGQVAPDGQGIVGSLLFFPGPEEFDAQFDCAGQAVGITLEFAVAPVT
jgi:hypothetical protein